MRGLLPHRRARLRSPLASFRSPALGTLAVALVLTSLPRPAIPPAAAHGPAAHAAAELFIAEGPHSGTPTPHDGDTLEVVAGLPEAATGWGAGGWTPVLSADGSTLAVVDGNRRRVIVKDGLFGPERVKIDAAGGLGELVLSRD